MDTSPIVIPARPSDPRRPPIRVLAAVVPLAGGILMWLFSGSVIALCVAALGPLMLVASVLDGARSRRRERRKAGIEHEQAWQDAEGELARRQDQERARRRSRHPDAATCLAEPPLRSGETVDAATLLVVGAGTRPSGIRTTGGCTDDRARDFQERCGVLDGAPVAIPLGGGVCVRGATPISAAVGRALVVQLCLRFGAGQLALTGDGVQAHGLAGLPHARAAGRGAFRLALTDEAHPAGDADALIRLVEPGGEVPEGITTVLDVVEPRRAELRTPDGVGVVSVEALSREQAQAAGASLADGAAPVGAVPASVALSDVAQRASSTGLPATIGRGTADDLEVDIVEDGPHAIVTGMTGSGKSELLVSWVAAIAAQHPPSRVGFVLADFKGGTAFEALSALPQVAAVITDLDEAGARRGVSSLTAELRRREGVLAVAGARDIAEVDMPRLVIVVDEFAALLQEHPDLRKDTLAPDSLSGSKHTRIDKP